MKQVVIVPAFNEAEVISNVIAGIKKILPTTHILVVDDGSMDETKTVADAAGAIVVRHPLNRGLGGAIGTGLFYAKTYGFDAAVTFDADDQHDPQDLTRCFEWLRKDKADVIIGNRFGRKNTIPKDRIILNAIANLVTFLLFGTYTHDSQSGFRGFNRQAIEQIEIKTDRMEVSSEIFGEIARLHLRFSELPIHVRYSHYSRYKGQKNSNAWPIFSRLVLRLFR